ncbi:hypothetical protein RMR21_015620 [Agrobacterium sp. rho-8.1]|nr:hypothetical protein [Agrobacterium sp. rho-8.1]
MKITVQDLTIFIAGFVAILSAYTVGSTGALGVLVGWELAVLVVPPNLYEMALAAVRVIILPTFAFCFANGLALVSRSFRQEHIRTVYIVLIILGLFVLGEVSDKWFTSELSDLMIYVVTTLIFALIILEGKNLNLSVVLMAALTLPFMMKGYMDQSREFKHTMDFPGRSHIVAGDKNYVNTKILRSTSTGVLIASGGEFIYYPMNQITQISRNQTLN